MIQNEVVSEAELLDGLRRRKPVFAERTPEVVVTVREIDLEFRTAGQKRSDIGLMNHALNVFLEPKNPFEPGRMRKPKMEAIVFGTLLSLAVIAAFAFNLAAPRP
jgi:hypothetical protein